jgi:phage tail-like protein
MFEQQLMTLRGNDSESHSRLLDYLPAIYHRSERFGVFLSAFEATLFGPEAGKEAGREETRKSKSLDRRINEIPILFDPEEAPLEFLPWLAQWAVLAIHDGMPEFQRRQLIARIIPLYRIRGTRAYLEQLLRLYTGGEPVVQEEDLPGMQVAVRSTVGHDTRLGEDPFRFSVSINFSPVPASREKRLRLLELSHLVISLAKPAHTHYKLTHNLADEKRGLVIYVRSTVGVNTLLWSEHNKGSL